MKRWNTLITTLLSIVVILATSGWIITDIEVSAMKAEKVKMQADLRHWKGIAYKVDSYIIQEVHDAQMETLRIAGELALCETRQNKPRT